MTQALPILLVAAVVLAWARLAWWYARAPHTARGQTWRVAALAGMQPICAALLYMTLEPPRASEPTGTLVVATAGAPRAARAAIALPEAPPIAGADRFPDLATALRQHPGATRLRIIGAGLEQRDREAVRGRALAFDPPPRQRGIIRLDSPPPVAPGAAFRISGQVAGVDGGRVDLIDPAGTRIDRQPLKPSGDFVVAGAARAAGLALVRIRVRDARGATIEEAEVPFRTTADPPPRLLLLAGAAGPEVKYLRRWATDAAMAVTTRVDAGGGVVLGDAAVPVNAATLGRVDVAIIDERSWAGLGPGARAALVSAVRSGMGLVVRITGAIPPETKRQWRALGVTVAGGRATVPAPLGDGGAALNRWAFGSAADAVPVWRDARGAVLADWRAVGRGRVALWAVDGSFALVLKGRADRYGEAWSSTVAAVARPRAAVGAVIPALPRAGERMALCAIANGTRVASASGDAMLAPDPASGSPPCAGYWPTQPGWHVLRSHQETRPFYVYPNGALPGIRARERTEATDRLRRTAAEGQGRVAERGASWPWLLALLIVTTVLWWFERARFGRATVAARTTGQD
jgi:hypothetical protein